LKGALTPHKKRHFAAITDPKKLGELNRVIRAYQGGAIVRAALQLAPMLFQRPNELRGAAWSEIDLDTRVASFGWLLKKRLLVPPFVTPLCADSQCRALYDLDGQNVGSPNEKGR